MNPPVQDPASLRPSKAGDQTSSAGYVPLQTIPYRSHHLTLEAVMANTSPGDRIFEGGVSSGYFAQLLVAQGRHVEGVEIDEEAAEQARRVCDLVVVGDLNTMDLTQFAPGYAALLFGDTLEHLPDPVVLLQRLKPLLKPDGVLIISIPNVGNWTVRLNLLFGRFRYTHRGIMDKTHLRFYTKKTLVDMLAEAGFRVEKIAGSIPVPGIKARWLCWLVHVLGNLRSSFFAYQFVVTARPQGR